MKRLALNPAGIGPDMGLTVLLNLSSNDYYYPMNNFVGAKALIFKPDEFPDTETGGLSEGKPAKQSRKNKRHIFV